MDILDHFKETNALLDGHFILSSGLHSSKYLQCALALQRPSDAAGFGEAIAEQFTKELTAVEEDVYQVRNQSNQDPLNFPIMLNNRFASLQGVVESADTRPTDQSYEIFSALSAKLDEQMKKLDTAVEKDLPQVNQMLQRQKLAPIKAEPLKPTEEKKPKSDQF